MFGTDHGLLVFEHEGEVDLEVLLFLGFEFVLFAFNDLFLDLPVEFVAVEDEELLGLGLDISDQIPDLHDLPIDNLLNFQKRLILHQLDIILIVTPQCPQLLVQNSRLDLQLLADQQTHNWAVVVIILTNRILKGLKDLHHLLALFCKGF